MHRMLNIVNSLHELAALRISGCDSFDFLQGQLSADLRTLTTQNWLCCAYCSPQGKVLAFIWLLRDKEDFLLLLPLELRDSCAARLRLFVLRSQVTIANAPLLVVPLLTAQDNAIKDINYRDFKLINTDNSQTLCGLPGISLRLQHKDEHCHENWQQLWRLWRWRTIELGIGAIYSATQDLLSPYALNLQMLGGISANKGCYVGQEIIARSRTRQHLQLRCATFKSNGAPTPNIATKLRDARGRSATIIDCVRHDDNCIVQVAIGKNAMEKPLSNEDLTLVFK